MRIAFLEDEPTQARVIEHALNSCGHSCTVFQTGRSLVHALSRESFDLLLLDWELPDMTGEEVLVWVRKQIHDSIPVIFCTSRGEERDVVRALASGADDYMVKPLRLAELLARVTAIQRRARPAAASALEVGNVKLDFARRQAIVGGNEIDLPGKEFDLCVAFFSNVNKVLSRSHLLETVWGISDDVATRTLDTYVSRLRKRLGLAPAMGWKLSAVYQYGYQLSQV